MVETYGLPALLGRSSELRLRLGDKPCRTKQGRRMVAGVVVGVRSRHRCHRRRSSPSSRFAQTQYSVLSAPSRCVDHNQLYWQPPIRTFVVVPCPGKDLWHPDQLRLLPGRRPTYIRPRLKRSGSSAFSPSLTHSSRLRIHLDLFTCDTSALSEDGTLDTLSNLQSRCAE